MSSMQQALTKANLKVKSEVARAVDVKIEGANGFYSITANSWQGRQWMNNNVQQSERGQAYSDDTRMMQDIADAAVNADMIVHVNSRRYLGDNRLV